MIGRVLAIRIETLSWERKKEMLCVASSSGDLRRVKGVILIVLFLGGLDFEIGEVGELKGTNGAAVAEEGFGKLCDCLT